MKSKSFFNKNLPCKKPDLHPVSFEAEKSIAELSFCSSKSARACLSYEDAKKYQVLPLGISESCREKIITFVCGEQASLELEKTLAFLTSRKVQLKPVKDQQLLPAIFTAYQGDDDVLAESKLELLNVDPAKFIKIKYQDFQTASNPESAFLDKVIKYAVAKNASDIHIIPRAEGSMIKLRIDGELFEHNEALCSLSQHRLIVNRLKVLANLNLSESRLPQDGSLKIRGIESEVPIRLSLLPTVFGEKAVLRIQFSGKLYSLSELGFTDKSNNFLLEAIQSMQGLIVFSGPTGSGKTSSMYAALQELSSKNCSIASIEDPVEIPYALVDQTSINEAAGLSYAQCLKSVLRQDPDVILIGEIRDQETAKIAVQAALSGHLIFTTLHTGNVFQIISRLKNFNIADDMLGEVLKLLINQRLLPCLCQHCKVVDLQGTARFSKEQNIEIYRAAGCSYCGGSGYSQRQIITESLLLSEGLKAKVAENKFSVHNAKKSARFYDSHRKQLETLLFSGRIDLLTFNSLSFG